MPELRFALFVKPGVIARGKGMVHLGSPLPPTQRRRHPSPSGLAWAIWGIGAPHGGGEPGGNGPPLPPHIAAVTPKSLRSRPGRLGDRDAPRGGR